MSIAIGLAAPVVYLYARLSICELQVSGKEIAVSTLNLYLHLEIRHDSCRVLVSCINDIYATAREKQLESRNQLEHASAILTYTTIL